jgi:hypothetical protein
VLRKFQLLNQLLQMQMTAHKNLHSKNVSVLYFAPKIAACEANVSVNWFFEKHLRFDFVTPFGIPG